MVAGNKKSNTLRQVFVKTPGGRTVSHYRARKPSHMKCECGAILSGVPRDVVSKIRAMTASERKPSRPYGGKLCSKCMRLAIKAKLSAEE